MTFRDLRADEIQVRVQSIKTNGLILLLYKDARCDMNILDEAVGAENWQREPFECKGVLYCRVSIYCDGRWVDKTDCGVESDAEAQKGESSDAFKRACVNWGIGRELYTSPLIWIPGGNYRTNDKGKCYDDFAVEKIKIENKKIIGLSIVNNSMKENGKPKRVFVWTA